jgi:uncharacterized protein (DUF697 family)
MAEETTAATPAEKTELDSLTTAPSAEVSPEHRQALASKLVDKYAIWAGVAGLIPVPGIDLVAIGGLQIHMLRRISQIYDVGFSENIGKALIASLAGTMIPATSGVGAASLLKAVPLVGTITAGFVMPVLSSGATFAIGKAFIQHFESGGTLLDFNPPDYREFLRNQKELWDLRKKNRSTPPAPANTPVSTSENAQTPAATQP